MGKLFSWVRNNNRTKTRLKFEHKQNHHNLSNLYPLNFLFEEKFNQNKFKKKMKKLNCHLTSIGEAAAAAARRHCTFGYIEADQALYLPEIITPNKYDKW